MDYAGLFPPAALPFEIAVRCFDAYLEEDNPWMISRFVCPVNRFSELVQLDTGSQHPFPVAGLIRKSPTESLADCAKRAGEMFRHLSGTRHSLSSLEIWLPADSPEVELNEFVSILADSLNELANTPDSIPAFFEFPLSTELAGSPLQRIGKPHRISLCLKARCGGLKAENFPSVKEVSLLILYCIEHTVPFKCTAGLHHPVRYFNESIKTWSHGFWNIFGAAILGKARRLQLDDIQEIVSEKEIGNFSFSTDTFRWKDLHCTVDEIHDARNLATSFGSCSFDEPREDLWAAGLLHN